jgi:dTDP-4-amino-4,6-dideoxygalactose transaminase
VRAPHYGPRSRLPGDASGKAWLTVSAPLLPDPDALNGLMRDIFARRWLTNQGHYATLLEQRLQAWMGAPSLALMTNGTVAIDIMIRAAVEGGEVICPAFSFPATWNMLADNPRYRPVFVDCDPFGNIDPDAVEAAMGPHTAAILAVHAYGLPCDHERLAALAAGRGVPLLYDAAHAMGVRWRGLGIAALGDFSAFSFHATKVFNTLEGGCLVAADPERLAEVARWRNFGLGPGELQTVFGQNGKMDELRAAFGVLALDLVDGAIAARARVDAVYRERLAALGFEGLRCLPSPLDLPDVQQNHAYFPVFLGSAGGAWRERLERALVAGGVLARRYFDSPVLRAPIYAPFLPAGRLPQTAALSSSVLCLPIHHEMTDDDAHLVMDILARCPPEAP